MYANTKIFSSFKEGIEEVRKFLPYIKSYTGESTDEHEVAFIMMEYIKTHYPSYDNPEFPAVPSFSINASGVQMRIGNSYSLTWRVMKTNKDGTRNYRFIVSFFNGIVTQNERLFNENGWEPTNLPEDKIYYNKKRKYYNRDNTKYENNATINDPLKVTEEEPEVKKEDTE